MKHTLIAILLSFVAAQAGATVIENFDDGDISNYTFVNGSGATPTASASAAHDGAFGLAATNNWWAYRDDAPVQLTQGDTFSAWIQFNDLANGRAYFGFGASAAGTLSFVLAPNTGQILFQENASYSFSNIGSGTQNFTADHWYLAEVIWGLGGSLVGNLYDSDGLTLLNTVNANSNLYTSGGIAFRGLLGVKSFDTVEVQTAAVPEPASFALFGLGALGVFAAHRRKTA